jgi:hypothetical protein
MPVYDAVTAFRTRLENDAMAYRVNMASGCSSCTGS